MENTLSIALSRQAALARRMSMVANNIANINTDGYRAERMMFVDHLVKSRGGERILGTKLAFVRDVASYRDVREGELKATGNPLDVAINGDGYFAVDTPTGERYTRAGSFQVNEAGQLVTADGYAVLSEGGQPFFLSTADKSVSISEDGTVSTENGPLGRVRVVRFQNNQNLEQVVGGLLATDAAPEAVEGARLVQGATEGSNVNGVIEMAEMIKVHRAYDSARRIISTEDERIKKMVEEYAR